MQLAAGTATIRHVPPDLGQLPCRPKPPHCNNRPLTLLPRRRGFSAHPGCEVVAACDICDEAIGIARREFPGVKRWTRDAAESLRDKSIDVVSIATYDTEHFEMAATAIRHGKHVFVEKPLCMALDEMRVLKALLKMRPGCRR